MSHRSETHTPPVVTYDGQYRAPLIAAAKRYAADRARVERSRASLAELVKAATLAGMTEQAVADLVGVTRMTIRKWLGKS